MLSARIAETFHQMPTVVARDLDNDPAQLSLACLSVLQYAEAYAAEKRAKSDDDMKPWKGSRVMETVLKNKFALFTERRAAREAKRAEEENGRSS